MEEIKEIILSHCKGIAYPEFELEDLNVMVKEINDHYTNVKSQELTKAKSLNQKLANGNAEFLDKIKSQAKEIKGLRGKVKLYEQFIKNGVETNNIRIPDLIDPARKTIDELLDTTLLGTTQPDTKQKD